MVVSILNVVVIFEFEGSDKNSSVTLFLFSIIVVEKNFPLCLSSQEWYE